MELDESEQLAFQIISTAGNASSLFYKALDEARKGNEYLSLIEQANHSLVNCYKIHSELINLRLQTISLLMAHAQNHLMNAELVKNFVLIVINQEIEIQALKQQIASK